MDTDTANGTPQLWRRAWEILVWYDRTLNEQPDDTDPNTFERRFDERVRSLMEDAEAARQAA
jgi:hypothetical protein